MDWASNPEQIAEQIELERLRRIIEGPDPIDRILDKVIQDVSLESLSEYWLQQRNRYFLVGIGAGIAFGAILMRFYLLLTP